MNKTILTALIWCTSLLQAGGVAYAEERPTLLLSTFHGSNITHSINDPLLLTVAVENGAAKVISRQNQRNREILDQYAQTEQYKSLNKLELSELDRAYPIRAIPEFSLGSALVSLPELINFQLRDENAAAVNPVVRLLASNDRQRTSINLDGQGTRDYQFAVEIDELQKLPPGDYQIAATLDTTNRKDMWQGWVYSQPISVKLVQKHPDPAWPKSNLQSLMVSTYLIADQQYAEAEQHARQWTTRHPDSVDAWAQLGEALHGQGQSDAAIEAFNTALVNFRSKHGNRPQELPEEILDRLKQIQNPQP